MDLFPETLRDPDLAEGLFLHRGAITPDDQTILVRDIAQVADFAPFRHPRTPGGHPTSAAMTNAGQAGWWSDRQGYRYLIHQPDSDRPWPSMPASFHAAVEVGTRGTPWPDFSPDACLINFYGAAAKMGLHQDKDERDFTQPIVTVSLGDAADFLVGGFARTDKTAVVRLHSGDVLVMGGPSRMRFHGVRRIHTGTSPLSALHGRYSLTFRKAF